MKREVTGTVTACDPNSSALSFRLDTAGPVLRGTVEALLGDDGDARMDPQHEISAVSEASRFAEAILDAYVGHYGSGPGLQVVRPSGTHGFPTGLLYGCVQSGKTRAITLTAAMLFDNGIRVVVVLTSNNVELVSQTAERLRLIEGVQKVTSLKADKDRWERDEKHIATHIQQTGLLVVCQKERSHQRDLIDFLSRIGASNLPAVIFDDEADQATPDTTQAARAASRQSAPSHGSTTYRLTVNNDRVDELGQSLAETLSRNVFVQVTATPYALLLQHTNHPLRPKFTRLIEPGDGYLGGEWFFPEQARSGEPKPPLIEVAASEATSLAAGSLPAPPEMLRHAIAYFCVAAAIADGSSTLRSKHGYSFLCHTSSKQADHDHLEKLIGGFLDQIARDLATETVGDVSSAMTFAIEELRKTYSGEIDYHKIRSWILRWLPLRNMRIINAEGDSLNLAKGLNFLIGGNILGRGLTIKRLLVTYYMRNARTTQMDTMLQHARMFGYRGSDKAFIRVFLPRTSIRRFADIVAAEGKLRRLMRATHPNVVPIRVAANLNATRRNILDTGSLDAYEGGQQIYPWEPEYEPSALGSTTDRITAALKQSVFQGEIVWRKPVATDWSTLEELVRSVRVRDTDDSRWLPTAIINVCHALRSGSAEAPLPLVYCRPMPRRQGPQLMNGAAGGDDPSKQDPATNTRVVLMMFLSPGDLDLDWGGAPFWYPTVLLPRDAGVFLFNTSE